MVKYIKLLIMTIFLMMPAATIFAQDELSVKTSLTPESALAGQEISYTVAFEKNDNVKSVEVPEKKKYMDEMAAVESKQALIPIFEITEIIKEESPDSPEIKYTFKLLYYRTGIFTLPEVLFFGKDNVVIGYKIPQVEIKSAVQNDQVLPDEPPLDLKGNYTRLILLILGVVVATALITLLIIHIVRRLKRKPQPEIKIPPIEIFRGEIAELESKNYLSSGMNEIYCIEISHIFKKFISSSMNIDAVEMTSEELITAVNSNAEAGMNGKIIVSKINDMTQLWDLSKFAEFDPSAEIMNKNLLNTKEAAEKIIWEKGNVRFRI